MGFLTKLSKYDSFGYGGWIILTILGIFLLFTSFKIYGIILIITAVVFFIATRIIQKRIDKDEKTKRLVSLKTAQRIHTSAARNTEKTLKKGEHIGAFIGAVIGGMAGLLYKHFAGIDSTPYTGNSYYLFIPIIVGTGLGALVDWLIRKKK